MLIINQMTFKKNFIFIFNLTWVEKNHIYTFGENTIFPSVLWSPRDSPSGYKYTSGKIIITKFFALEKLMHKRILVYALMQFFKLY